MWIRPLITYLGASLIVFLPLSQGPFSTSVTLLLYGLGVIVLLSHINEILVPDFQHGHLAWLLSHRQPVLRYFLTKIIHSFTTTALPLTVSFFCIHLFAYSPLTAFILSISFLMTLGTILCWGLLLSVSQGQNGQSLLGITLAPLAIPNLLIAESLVSSIAVQAEPSYYLGMQLGVLLVSGGLSICLAPLIIQNLDW